MRPLFLLLVIWGGCLSAQVDYYTVPTPEVPVLNLDLDHDGIPEFEGGVYYEGTDDVPSSSGSHIYHLVAKQHVEMLCPNHNTYDSYTPLWTDAAISTPPEGAYHWVQGCGLELAWLGYGNNLSAGWEFYARELRKGKRVWIRFRTDEKIWLGWLSFEFEPGTLHLQRLGHEVWRMN